MNGYSETLEYLYGLERFGIIFGLDRINGILSQIGNPHNSFAVVHVGGTNGKGSVAAMLAASLRSAGYATGLYISPHLNSFTERITVNGQPISEEEIIALTRFIRGSIPEDDGESHFTFFDFTTALAFEYFRRQKVEVAVVEVGMGGRLDSTNVITPLVTVITNVEYDHQEYLGTTIEEIAREKAGIIKNGVPVVTGAEGAALEVIKETASGRSPILALGEAFRYHKQAEQTMTYRSAGMTVEDLSINLKGDHQLFNGALALCALEVIADKGFPVTETAIRKSFSSVRWPGRLELIDAAPDRPAVLLDGAHNPGGARVLGAYLRDHFNDRKKILVFGAMKDKDLGRMLKEILPLVDHTVLTRPQMERAAAPSDLAAFAPDATVTSSIPEAIGKARAIAGHSDLIIVTGSLFTVGEARSLIEKAA